MGHVIYWQFWRTNGRIPSSPARGPPWMKNNGSLCAIYGIKAGPDEKYIKGSSVHWLNGYPISREIIADRLEFHGCKNSISQ